MTRQSLIRSALGAVAAAVLAAPTTAQVDRPFVRYPAISPDGRTVAFSYQGDIWTVPVDGGRAVRLTLHEAYEARPRFSPDGARIAFTSDRWGNDDLYVMDADGSAPTRLTFHSSGDVLGGWTADGRLLFETDRTWVQVERESEIYRVSADGGTPDRLLDAVGYTPRLSPDGRFLAFTFGSNGADRIRYRGPADKDVWLYDTERQTYAELTGDFDGNDIEPVWGGARTLFFVSERDGTYNLYRTTVAEDGTGSPPEQLTRYTEDGVRFFDVSADGGTVVMEVATDIHVLRGTGEPERLDILVPADDRFDDLERRTYTDDADEYAVSPNGERIAFVVRGEVFVTENDPDESRAVRLTSSPYRDRDVVWADDETLIFASDRAGQYDLYRIESADPERPDLFRSLKRRIVRLTETEAEEHDVVMVPDGAHLAFVRDRGTLVVAELRDGELRDERVLLDGWATPEGVAWSPDSRWLAYGLDDLDFNTEVYIHAADGSVDPVNVTMHPKGDGAPVWSKDGSKLGFISQRNNGDADVWFAWLRQEDWEKTRQDWEQMEEPEEEETGEEDQVAPIEIDLEDIHERLEQVTSLPGNETDLAVSHDGETFYFVAFRGGRQSYDADQDLYSVKWDGTDMKALTTGGTRPSGVTMGPEGKHLYMVRPGGRLARLAPESNGRLESLPYSARMTIDHPAERAQVFDEAWRILGLGFYDPGFHGRDWNALRDKYRPWALRASTKRDFRDVFDIMLGELNASHLGLYGSDRAETQTERTGLLGIEIDPVDDGVVVRRVVPGSPADREASKLAPGDVVTAMDGTPVTPDANFYALLADRSGEKTILTVRSGGDEREVVIRPTDSLRRQLYDEWVQDRQRLTEDYSDGRLGYIHIQGMNWPSFERFERELVASGQGKDGIIVDVRYNGGGWTTDYLMAVLTVRQHAYTVPRGAAEDLDEEHTEFRDHYPFGERLPLAAWTRPVAALCNQNSFSNAEIFSHAFKHLGLGPLVGTPTFGAVISTGGAGLMDGSFVRLPFRGWYVKATDRNMENGPAVPDVIVPARPDDRADGEDEQLRAAVNVLLEQVDGGM